MASLVRELPVSGSTEITSSIPGANAWASPDCNALASWRRADLLGVRPMTLEFAPSLACNAACTECPYRGAREASGCGRIARGEFARADDTLVSSLDLATCVLERATVAGVRGVLWTGGGEPLVTPDVVAMIRRAAEMELAQMLYTNGIQLGVHPDLARELLSPLSGLHYLRISINAVGEEVAKAFSGATAEDVRAQIQGLANCLAARADHVYPGPRPAVRVSMVVDHRNVDDIPNVAAAVADTYRQFAGGRHPLDHFLVRPLTHHGRETYALKDHEAELCTQILGRLGRNGDMRGTLQNAGVSVALGYGLADIDRGDVSNHEEWVGTQYAGCGRCWANGLFLTVGPDATAYLCVDRNCDPDYAIGNLRDQSVEQVYDSPARRRLLDRVHAGVCGPTVCPPTCRARRLNAIADRAHRGGVSQRDLAHVRNLASDTPPLLLG